MRRCGEAFLLMVLEALLCSAALGSREPDFAEPARNVTVIRGRDAELPCVINHLGDFHAAWIKVDTQTILTIHKSVVTRNYRITLRHHDHRNWFLHIKNVSETDRGFYMCQINTVPMKNQLVFLNVTVSPNIIDEETSSDLIVNESINVTLTCRANGYPPPTITWEREDGQDIALTAQKRVKIFRGEDLVIIRVSRLHMGAYLCIASNQVPPAVSKRVVLKVHFSPMIWVPNQRVSGSLNSEVMLECHTEAFPKSINYWTNERGDMVTSADRFTTILVDTNYKVTMKLKINKLEDDDFGSYRCFAKNSLGDTDGTIRLEEIVKPTPQFVTTTDRMNFESQGFYGEGLRSGANYETEHTDRESMTTRGRNSNISNTLTGVLDNAIDIHQKPQQAETASNRGFQQGMPLQSLSLLLVVLTLVL